MKTTITITLGGPSEYTMAISSVVATALRQQGFAVSNPDIVHAKHTSRAALAGISGNIGIIVKNASEQAETRTIKGIPVEFKGTCPDCKEEMFNKVQKFLNDKKL